MFHLILRAAVMTSPGPTLAQAAWISHEAGLAALEEPDDYRWIPPTYRDLTQKEERESWFSKMTCKAVDFATSIFQSRAQTPKQIAVVGGVHVAGGRGDISGAIKIYRYVREIRPFDHVKLVLHRENLFDLMQFSPAIAERATFIEMLDPRPITNSDLAIYYPTSVADVDPDKLSALYANDQSSLCFNEYHANFTHIPTVDTQREALAKHNKFFYTLGVGNDTVGIMLDVKLYAEYKQNKLIPIQQLKPLATLPPLLQEKLLGERYNARSAARFLNHSTLYFGYSSIGATKEAFTTIVAQLDHNVNTTVALLGAPFFVFNPPNHDFFRNLRFAGVERLELYVSRYRNASSFAFHAMSFTMSSAPKTVRIFSFPEGLAYRHALAILKASGRETLVTGDQTISEALSLGKFPFYEVHSYKKLFANALVDVATNPAAKMIATKLFTSLHIHYRAGKIKEEGALKDGLAAFRMARQHHEEWDAYLEMLHERYNFFSTLSERIESVIHFSNKKRISAIGVALQAVNESA